MLLRSGLCTTVVRQKFWSSTHSGKKLKSTTSWLKQEASPSFLSLKNCTIHGILQSRILEWVAFPSPGNVSNPGIEPRSIASRFFTSGATREALLHCRLGSKIPALQGWEWNVLNTVPSRYCFQWMISIFNLTSKTYSFYNVAFNSKSLSVHFSLNY